MNLKACYKIEDPVSQTELNNKMHSKLTAFVLSFMCVDQKTALSIPPLALMWCGFI